MIRRFANVFARLLLATAACLSAPAGAAPGDQPVSVLIVPVGAPGYRVSVLYPSVVGAARSKAELADLWRRAGWKATAVDWYTSPSLKGFPAQTSCEFTVPTPYSDGEFPVEACALAFRSWGAVKITFAHGATFRYSGQPHYEDADAAMDVTAGTNSLAVSVRVKNPRLERVHFTPMRGAPPTGPAAPPVRRTPLLLIAFLAVAAAGATGTLVYVALKTLRNRAAR